MTTLVYLEQPDNVISIVMLSSSYIDIDAG